MTAPTAPSDQHTHIVSPQPPDEVQPVQVATAQALDAAAPEQRYRIVSVQPADVVQDVAVATPPDTTGAAGAQSLGDDGDDDIDIGTVALKDPDHSTVIAAAESPAQPAPVAASTVLDNAAMIAVIREVAWADSGPDTYAAVSQDSEWAARGGGRHFGLGFGLVLATQESGDLGTVLTLTRKRDAVAFNAAFGPDADALIATTTAATPDARLAPVGGSVLWSDSWAERFRIAGTLAVCQAAQNEQAIEGLFRPMLDVAGALGLDTDRGLAMVFDRVVVRGLGGGLGWVVDTCGPLRTQQQRDAALALLGLDSVAHFQATLPWLPKDGTFGPQTHAALVGALRRDGRAALPDGAQLQASLVRGSQGAARARLLRLRDSSAFSDTAYRLA